MVVQPYSVHGDDARVLCELSELSIGILFRRSDKYPFSHASVDGLRAGVLKFVCLWVEHYITATKVRLSSSIVKSETLSRFRRTFVSLLLGASFAEHTNICDISASDETYNPSSSAMRSVGICFGLLRRPRCHPRISVKWALKKEEVGEIDRVLSSIAKPLPWNK
jgi:hypothetical protein